jgi:ribosomal protein L12E/L44/L45/RPP1/RPP2|tara:strand:- start:415 stop:696 length:282 start_codon:yes stop_codon:yes gene_type:complete
MDEALKKKLKEFIRYLYEKELEEITTTGDVDGYSTPFAFDDTDEPGSRKKKKEARKNIKEEISEKDMKEIKSIIRKTVANVLRDIWLKRSTWV